MRAIVFVKRGLPGYGRIMVRARVMVRVRVRVGITARGGRQRGVEERYRGTLVPGVELPPG